VTITTDNGNDLNNIDENELNSKDNEITADNKNITATHAEYTGRNHSSFCSPNTSTKFAWVP